jgi:hypothetical protein
MRRVYILVVALVASGAFAAAAALAGELGNRGGF